MKIFVLQLWHFLSLLFLLSCIYFLVSSNSINLIGSFLGVSTTTWFFVALLSPILHQVYVLVFWRLELYYKSVTNAFGNNGFKLFKIGFAILILSRLITIILLAYSDQGTVQIDATYAYLLAGIFFVPSAYLFYSVKKYFGMDRAFGVDHFKPEQMKNETFVKKGIFKYTSNGMYIYGFLILYVPGFLLMSKAALVAALFNHAYIWVHYYCTELPDIKFIYKP